MYGIYTNIGGISMVNVSIYIPYMDPMGMEKLKTWIISISFQIVPVFRGANITPHLPNSLLLPARLISSQLGLANGHFPMDDLVTFQW